MLLGEIMFYIQFHVIRNPMYNILLGRPFDILLESIVHNYKNEDQTITIHDHQLQENHHHSHLRAVLICAPAAKLWIFATQGFDGQSRRCRICS